MSNRISFLALALAAMTAACGFSDVEDDVEKAASVGSFAMASTDSTDANMNWSTTNTRIVSYMAEVQSLIAEGPGETALHINLQGISASGEYEVTDDNARYPAILISHSLDLDLRQAWVSVAADSAVVTLEPLTVKLKGVVMEPGFDGGQVFTFDGEWVEK